MEEQRTREEIMKEYLESKEGMKTSIGAINVSMGFILHVLLDIRDLLTPKEEKFCTCGVSSTSGGTSCEIHNGKQFGN